MAYVSSGSTCGHGNGPCYSLSGAPVSSIISTLSLEERPHSVVETEWLSGWNFVTDLYRGLEHLLTKFRLRRLIGPQGQQRSALSTTSLLDIDLDKIILRPLTIAFGQLTYRFESAFPLSLNVMANRCRFQTANIICTYQV